MVLEVDVRGRGSGPYSALLANALSFARVSNGERVIDVDKKNRGGTCGKDGWKDSYRQQHQEGCRPRHLRSRPAVLV